MASILLVEDDAMIARMIKLRLELAYHKVTLAENGLVGMQKALSGDFDLVLMDLHMPEMDGHEAVQRLREQEYKGLIAAVTASAMSDETRQALESGCDNYITKPIGDNFELLVSDILQRKQ